MSGGFTQQICSGTTAHSAKAAVDGDSRIAQVLADMRLTGAALPAMAAIDVAFEADEIADFEP